MANVFALPFRFAGGRAVTVPRDSRADVDGCLEALLRTELGQRLELPEYGVPDQTFRTNGPDAQPIRDAIERWEDRATVRVEADASDLKRMIGRVQVTTEQQTAQG
ncbi:MAG TPA: GPW/gp25 family protein [Chloroflexota bacterium]|nr:GPW/gp25 family protein [Chloroflexota bacterium]